jgi:F-type H+-transporting ATPase subunit epsilon
VNISVLTPGKEVYNGEITSVKVPGITGQFEILRGHAAIVSALGAGPVRIIASSGETINYTIEKGFIEVLNDEVALLVQGLTE